VKYVWAIFAVALATMSCADEETLPLAVGGGGSGGGGGGSVMPSYCESAQQQFRDLADLHKYTIARTCAFEGNNCHFDEDPPPLHTVALTWNIVGMPCNVGVPDYADWDPFCKAAADGGSDGKIVVPGNAAESYLMIRLRADAEDRTQRIAMPNGSEALSDKELYAIEAWINSLEAGVSTPSDPIDYSKTPCPG
jgi:hypothetical protein